MLKTLGIIVEVVYCAAINAPQDPALHLGVRATGLHPARQRLPMAIRRQPLRDTFCRRAGRGSPPPRRPRNISHSSAQTARIARAAAVRELAEPVDESRAPPAGTAARSDAEGSRGRGLPEHRGAGGGRGGPAAGWRRRNRGTPAVSSSRCSRSRRSGTRSAMRRLDRALRVDQRVGAEPLDRRRSRDGRVSATLSPGRPRSRATAVSDPMNHVLGGYSRYTRRGCCARWTSRRPRPSPLLGAVDVLRSDGTARPTGFLRPNSRWSRLFERQFSPTT